MQYDFLKQFPRRMKNVGLYSILVLNSTQKTTWKQYGFIKTDEQINMIYAVMLYLMEQSLKEENCTMDDIGAYIDGMNTSFFRKPMSYEDCRALGDFIVNVILSNEGRAMYFEGYDFEEKAYQVMNVSYVANRVVYLENEIKRTSYYLTDDGYNLMLSTLEIENNMKLTIHEMIFQMHLEKQSYDKAVDEIKTVFSRLRIQLQKIQETMTKIRRNALNYSVSDYEQMLHENMQTIDETKGKFLGYRELVQSRVRDLEEENINVRKLSAAEEENLGNLQVIESYLNRSLDELQRILGSHFDLKSLYTKELEALSQMSLIRRFSLRNELYDKILEYPEGLEDLIIFLRPLFGKEMEKTYQLNKALEFQRPVRKKQEEDSQELFDFDEEEWLAEQERKFREKRKKYTGCLSCILKAALKTGDVTLEEIGNGEICNREEFLPDVEIFKEVMVELIRNREMDVEALRKERSENITAGNGDFQLNELLLDILDDFHLETDIRKVTAVRVEDGKTIVFNGVRDEKGNIRNIRCSNVRIGVERI